MIGVETLGTVSVSREVDIEGGLGMWPRGI